MALLIGNSEYEQAPLTNPARDVRRLGATLQALGFHLVGGMPKENLGKAAMERALRDFRAYLGPDTVALFYFSGHGLSIRDTSYLVPVAVEPKGGEEGADTVFVNVRDIVTAMGGSGSRLSMILLDACRSVVYQAPLRERTSPGLAALQAPGSVLISYSTQPGNVASDGDPNADSGPYIAALTEALMEPGLSFIDVFNRAGLLVSERSAGKQRPWLSLSPIAGGFVFLAPGAAPPRLGVPPPRPAAAPTVAGFRDCPDCPEMVAIAPARFEMGSDKGEADEQPVHAVTLARPFAIGRTEVTFAEWDACVAGGGCRHRPDDLRWGRGRPPVINVSWQDAQDYARWLSQRSGRRYRLPSEAEWEHVARSGGPPPERPIMFGVANCNGCGSEWDHRQPGPVASFRANALGVHDMLGNVWEWVEDCYAPGYARAPADGTAVADAACARRAVRGGSWADRIGLVRATNRGAAPTSTRNPLIGFRVVREE
ncbi:MAG: SUMF1/EgtB/PvdO family nonheme iron enzyme [Alphaproteobacteria bacterium]|nr:SUMF1/EgtB/PvdO family nonheme iron enzyme [Alphaproteobacteria bacterium]